MQNDNQLDSWFLENLVCPLDKSELSHQKDQLSCEKNHHTYPVFADIPIMLVKEEIPTHGGMYRTWDIVNEKIEIESNLQAKESKQIIDPYVQKYIAETNSNFYMHLIGKLQRYPIPSFPIEPAKGKLLLDIGCNWGRWCLSASKIGFNTVGIDPILESILAAKKVSKQLGVKSRYLVADARFLPFRKNLFDYSYSYSVFQHFSKSNVQKALSQIKYVLKSGGISQHQMLNKFGLRSIYSQLRRGFQEPVEFQTRYWSPSELLSIFEKNIGPTKILLGSFFTQGQITDQNLFNPSQRMIFQVSQLLSKLSNKIRFFVRFADNLFLVSEKKY